MKNSNRALETKRTGILTKIMKQICQCNIFIQNYSKDGKASEYSANICLTWLRSVLSSGSPGKEHGEYSGPNNRANAIRPPTAHYRSLERYYWDDTFECLPHIGYCKEPRAKASWPWYDSTVHCVNKYSLFEDMDTKLRELNYASGARFNPEKRCLQETRNRFLDFIANWVHNSSSERVLLLLG